MASRDYAAFCCVDCDLLLPTTDAAYDVDQEGERGTRCQSCANEFDKFVQAWPRREVA